MMRLPAYDHDYLDPRMKDFIAFRSALRNEGHTFSQEVEAILYTTFRRSS